MEDETKASTKMLTLSIVTVSLNAERTLRRSLESVAHQTYPHIEHIVIDGGSTDGTLDILREFRTSLAHLTSEEDGGIYSAMNKGIRAATGDVLFFLNSDDYFVDETVLEDVAERFHLNPSLELVFGNIVWDVDGKLVTHEQPSAISRDYLARRTVIHQTIFAKRSLFEKAGMFSEELRVVSDYEWILKVFLLVKPVYEHIDRGICVMATSGTSWSTSWETERLSVMRNYFPISTILFRRSLPRFWQRSRLFLRRAMQK